MTLLGSNQAGKVNCAKVAENLNRISRQNDVELSSYGYVMWALEHGGPTALYKNGLMSPAMMEAYAQASKTHKEDAPVMLINAGKYVDKVFSTIQDPMLCMERLEGMTFPYVLYLLFAAAGQTRLVMKYKSDTEEHLRRYPCTLALLPASFKAVGEEVLCANAK